VGSGVCECVSARARGGEGAGVFVGGACVRGKKEWVRGRCLECGGVLVDGYSFG
jgi:hypothetical protein